MLSLLNRFRLFLNIFIFIILCTSSCKEIPKKKQNSFTQVDWEKNIKLDTIIKTDTVDINAWVKNTGDTLLIFKHIKTTCGCISANFKDMTINPNDSTFIHIKLLNNNAGYFNKNIYIFCNVAISPLKISIHGNCFNP